MRTRDARTIRAGILDGRRFMIAAKYNPGWVGGNLEGLHGEAFSRTVLKKPTRLLVLIADPLLGRYEGGFWWPSNKELLPGHRIEHDGRAGTITHVDTLSADSDLVVLVDWDQE